MLTPEEREAAYRQAEDFTESCADYRALLTHHELPLTVDLAQVERLYRQRLFEQLLAADAGLQARYALCRTPDAQQQLRAQTVGSLDLRGHELPDQLAQAVAGLERAWRAVLPPNEVPRLSLVQLTHSYGLDYGRLLDQHTMNWAGKEAARTYFEQLGQVLTGWQQLVQHTGGYTNSLPQLFNELARYFQPHQPGQPLHLNAKLLYQQLQQRPALLDFLTQAEPLPAELLAGWPDTDEADTLD